MPPGRRKGGSHRRLPPRLACNSHRMSAFRGERSLSSQPLSFYRLFRGTRTEAGSIYLTNSAIYRSF